MEEPVVGCGVALEPVEGHSTDFVSTLAATFPGVVDLIEVGVPVPGGVALTKGTDGNSTEAGLAETPHPARAGERGAKLAVRTFDEGVGGNATVIDDTGMNAEAAREESRTTGQTRDIGGIALVEADALSGDAIDVGTGLAVVAVAAEVIGAEGIDVDVEDAHNRGQLLGYSRPPEGGIATVRRGRLRTGQGYR